MSDDDLCDRGADQVAAGLLQSQHYVDEGIAATSRGLLIGDRRNDGEKDGADDDDKPLGVFVAPPTAAASTSASSTDEHLVATGSGAPESELALAAEHLGDILETIVSSVGSSVQDGIASGGGVAPADTPPVAGATTSSAASSAAPTPPVAAEEGAPAEAPAPATSEPTIGRLVPGAPAGWSMTPAGYIFGPDHVYRGRITCFRSNVSIKCQEHGCGRLTKRVRVSDAQLIAWLAAGVEQCGVSAETPVPDLARKHMLLFPL